jgi:chemotaxis protein MotB
MAIKKPHEEHENHERWLVSYADFITLLFAFFVVMYAVSQVDVGKLKALAGSLSSSFESPGGDPRPGGGAGPNMDAHADGGSMRPSPARSGPEEAGGGLTEGLTLKHVLDEVKHFVRENALEDTIRLQMEGNELLVAFRDQQIFRAGTAEITSDGGEMLLRVGSLLGPLRNPIRVRARATASSVGAVRLTPFGLAGARLESMVGFLATRQRMSPLRFTIMVYGDLGGEPEEFGEADKIPLPVPGWLEVVIGPSRREGEAMPPPPLEPLR